MEEAASENRPLDEVMAQIVDDLRFVQGALDRALDDVRNKNEVAPGKADEIEGLWGQARTVVEIGRTLVGRVRETADEIRAYEELPFDEEAAYEAVKDFLASNISTPFTVADLRAYLDEVGVVYPENKTDFNRLFKAWRGDVVTDLATDDHKLVWANIETLRGRPRQYALATIVRARHESVVALPEPEVRPREDEEVVTRSELAAPTEPAKQEGPELSHEAQLAFNIYTANSHLRAKALYGILMDIVSGLEEDSAARAYQELVDNGILHKNRREGSLYFSEEEPVRDKGDKRPAAQNEQRHQLDEAQKVLAMAILYVLAHLRAVGTPLEPREVATLLREKGHSGDEVDIDGIKFVCRAMERQGIVTTAQVKEGRGGRSRAKRSLVFKVQLNPKLAATYKQSPTLFSAAINTGEMLVLGE